MVEAPSSPVKHLMIAKETIWGTAVAADKDVGLIVTESNNTFEREVMESLGLGQIDTQKITTGIFDPKLTVNGEFQNGRMLEFVFGTVTHAETTGDWKHTFTVNNAVPSATISSSFDLATDIDVTNAGMIVESCEITAELNGKLMTNYSLVGKTVATNTVSETFSQSALSVFPHAMITVTINNVAATICQSVGLTVAKTALRAGGLGSNLYQQAAGDEMKYEVTATLGFDDLEYHALMLGGTSPSATSDPTSFDFVIDAKNGVALGSGQRQLYLALENVQFKGFNEATSVGGITFVEVTGVGTFKSAHSVDNISDTNW